MIDIGSWAETLGLRRKKTFVDRVQDAAEDVVETLADTVYPVLERSRKAASRGAGTVTPLLERSRDVASRGAESVTPLLEKSGKMAKGTWSTTAKTAAAGMSGAGDLAGDAASKMATGAAVTGAAAAGVATGIGGFIGAIVSWLWWLVTFLLKTALLVGVAYAGWQWLQARREQQAWSSPYPSSSPSVASGTYGTVSGAG